MTSTEVEAWRQRRAKIVSRYGSTDAATAPCERERLLLVAVAQWRQVTDGWTFSIDGWRGDGSAYQNMPLRALRAIETAIPLPTTFAAARVEAAYWDARNAELKDVLSEDGTFADSIALDLVAEVRYAIVRDLALFELPVTTLADLRDRMVMHREAGTHDPRFGAAIYRDVSAMAEAATPHPPSTRAALSERIGSALAVDPSRSDRAIARMLRCSPSSVGTARAAMGLQSASRTVSRGGTRFEMRLADSVTGNFRQG